MDWTGQYAIAVGASPISRPYYTTDFGDTWTRSANSGEGGTALAISANGSFAIAGNSVGGNVRISTDFGRTWHDRYHTGGDLVTTLATDWTGRLVIAGVPQYQITRSTSYNANWNYASPASETWVYQDSKNDQQIDLFGISRSNSNLPLESSNEVLWMRKI